MQVGGAIGRHSHGVMSGRELKKRKQSTHISDEEDGSYSAYISEEQYRAMLGDHIQKYKRRVKNSSPGHASNRTGTAVSKSSLGIKDQKLSNDQRGKPHRLDRPADFFSDNHTSKVGNFHGSDLLPRYATDRLAFFFRFIKIYISVLVLYLFFILKA